MTIRSLMSAIIGIWWVAAPWLGVYLLHPEAGRVSTLLGVLQLIFALSGFFHAKAGGWPDWAGLLVGVGAVIFAMTYEFNIGITFLFALLGLSTVLLHFYNIEEHQPS